MTIPDRANLYDFFGLEEEGEREFRGHPLKHYLRQGALPTAFCPGCGGGTVLSAFVHAVHELDLDPKQLCSVTGIGCSSWIPSPYFLSDTLHTTHGRAIAFATGVKVMRPETTVVIIAGDGDLAGIGGNHLIHAARRNIDLSVFLVNNFIYGMTGGQVSPTTPVGVRTTTTPLKNVEHPMQLAEVVAAAGASYVSRWTTYHVFALKESMEYALKKKGFSFIEILSPCPISYGKMVGMRDANAFMDYFQSNSIYFEEARGKSEEELAGKLLVGKLLERERTEFTEALRALHPDSAQGQEPD